MKYQINTKFIRFILIAFVMMLAAYIFIQPTNAQVGFCDLFPCNENLQDATASNTLSLGVRLALFAVGMIFTVFIAAGVVFILKAGLKIIRSEGDPSQIEGAAKIVKGVYAGVIILILGVVGLVIILAMLRSGEITNTPIEQPPGIVLPDIQQ